MACGRLRISADGRRIVTEQGAPFFYLADTAWELFHVLDRDEVRMYLDDRSSKGFTAVQAVALAELDGLRVPNAYGRTPLLRNGAGEYDPAQPDTAGEYSYWDHVDFAVEEAAKRGMYMALLPTWGDKWNLKWGVGPVIFTPENAYAYGLWIGKRYAYTENIIWVMGGDRPPETRRHFEILHAMACGVREGDGGAHLMTLHPVGGEGSASHVHEEDWLDFNMIQSGHARSRYNYEMIARDYARTPVKPVLDGEPGYEDHPESFDPRNGYMDDADVRRFLYMSLFSGACGHTYGDHSVWSMQKNIADPRFRPGHFCLTWDQAILSPGSGQMHHAADLVLAHDFLTLCPRADLVEDPLGGQLHIPVLLGRDCLLAYTAYGRPVSLRAGALDGSVTARWFDPRTGTYGERQPADLSCGGVFTPPTGGRGNDWVLVLERA